MSGRQPLSNSTCKWGLVINTFCVVAKSFLARLRDPAFTQPSLRLLTHPAGFVVAVLAAEVEWGESAPVLDVGVGLGLAEVVHRLAEPLPGRLVQRRVAVLKCESLIS